MKIIIVFFLMILLVLFRQEIRLLFPPQWWSKELVYSSIKDFRHPTLKEYHRLQKYLNDGKRPELTFLNDYEKKVRSLRLIGNTPDKTPQAGRIFVNCDENERENCLIVYASYNKGFPKGLERLVNKVSFSDFKGHILYKVGGWPNTEEGDLALAHVPYAFKVCFFREAKRLGYRKILWLDTSILPVVGLNQIFKEIEKKGYFTISNGWSVGPFLNPSAAAALGVTIEEALSIPSCSAGLFGVDISNKKALMALDEWYEKARDPAAFFSPRSDQNALSVILYKLNLQQMAPAETLVEGDKPILKETLFMIDRSFVHH